MKLTNRNNLPQPIVDAVAHDSYSRGDANISVTELIGPPRIKQLKLKHDAVLTEDVSDRLWALIGQIGHGILQRNAEAGRDTSLVEHRFFVERAGYRLSGQVDYLPETREINDYKFCSYHVAKNGVKPEWIQQLNIYRWMAACNGVRVDKLKIVAIYRDWSKMAANRQQDYPQEQVHVFELPIWTEEETEEFISERIKLHKAAETELPECTAEEKWEKLPRFALMVKGRKRAVKLYDTEAEAQAAVTDPKHFVEPRSGEWTRCEFYCPVAPFCTQFRRYMEDKAA